MEVTEEALACKELTDNGEPGTLPSKSCRVLATTQVAKVKLSMQPFPDKGHNVLYLHPRVRGQQGQGEARLLPPPQ